MTPTGQYPGRSHVRTSDEQDLVASIKGGATSSSDGEVTLQSNNNDLRILWYKLRKLHPSEGIDPAFVDEAFARQGFMDELPARGAGFINVSYVTRVSDVDN